MAIVLLAGHGPRGDLRLLRRAFGLCSTTKPTIAYVGAASEDDSDFFAWTRDALLEAGAKRVTLAPTFGGRPETARKTLEHCDIAFIGGGDVEVGMKALADADMVPTLEKLYAAGLPFIGVSAGSIMLGQRWVRWPDPKNDASAERFACLGFAPFCCDTHGEKDRWEELLALVGLSPEGTVSYGVPSGGALLPRGGGPPQAWAKPTARFAKKNGAAVRLTDLAPSEA